MTKQIREIPAEVLEFTSLSKYPVRKRLMIYFIDFCLYSVMSLIGKTVKFEIEGWEKSDIEGYESFEIAYKKRASSIIAFWHNRLFLMTVFWRGHSSAIMVSQSFDGEYISRIAQRFGYGVVRGSSTRGGSGALKKMTSLLSDGISMALTIDGPLGPRYVVKPGTIILAKKTGAPIGPVLVEPKKFWTINSWDKLQIPKPFTKAKVFIAEPVFVSSDADKEELEAKRQEVQEKLDELVDRGKQWRDSDRSV